MKDELGNRMKEFYEDRTRYFLPRRTYTIIRIDGKAFHSFTKIFKRPFDDNFVEMMNKTAIALCKEIQGVKLAFVQSDEISLVLTDFDDVKTCAWLDGNIQKMVSVSASIATAEFNKLHLEYVVSPNLLRSTDLAKFDSRVFTIPEKHEVINYLIWRQKDATKNSISSVAYSLYSNKELHGKNSDQKQEMIFQKGINWNYLDPMLKRGRVIVKEKYEKDGVERSHWVVKTPPVFTQNKEFLEKILP